MDEDYSKDVASNILKVLKNVKNAIQRENSDELAYWSDYLINVVGVQGQRSLAYVAIISYSISMIVQKQKMEVMTETTKDRFLLDMVNSISLAIENLEMKKYTTFESDLLAIMKKIYKFDNTFSKYITDVLDFAKIQKGAKFYQHGISLSSIADLLGVSKWDLMNKVSEIRMKHYPKTEKSPKERLRELRELSGKGD